MPQDSIFGPLLFSLYIIPLSKVIQRHSNINFHFYANNTQLFIQLSYKNTTLAFDKLNSCLQDVQKWMLSSILKLNPEKTEFIIFWLSCSAKKLDYYLPVRIFGKFLHPSAVVKNLGGWFDAKFSFGDRVCNICKTCFIQMCDLRWVRQYLKDEAVILVANALVSSCLDYCNSLLRSLSSFNMRKLLCIQNTPGMIVTNCNRYSWATPILKKLHWLPVEFRCVFKTATLVYKFLHSGHQVISALICLFIMEDMAQDSTIQIKGSWRILNTTHQYQNPKNTSVTVSLSMLVKIGMICLMMSVLLHILPVLGKS